MPEYFGTNTAPFTYQQRGTLSASGDVVGLYCPNTASVIITIDGTFEGRVTATGAIESGATEGARLLTKSGSGSTGLNYVAGDGTERHTEYSAVSGGDYFFLRASDWVSGSAEVAIYSQEAQNITLISGPVHTTFEEARRAGRAYSAGTSVQSVSSGDWLQYRFLNPVGSGVRCFVHLRFFSNSQEPGDGVLEYGFFPDDPGALSGATDVTPNNLKRGGDASLVEFEWVTSGTSLGDAPLGNLLPQGGLPFVLEVAREVDPGQAFAYQIGGDGNNQNAARINASVVWYQEDLQ